MASLHDILSLSAVKLRADAKIGDKVLKIEFLKALAASPVPHLPTLSWIAIGTSSIRVAATGGEDVQTTADAPPKSDATHYYYDLQLVDALVADHGRGDAIAFYPQIVPTTVGAPFFQTSIGKPGELDFRPYFAIAGPSVSYHVHTVTSSDFSIRNAPAGHISIVPKAYPTSLPNDLGDFDITIQIYASYKYYKSFSIRGKVQATPSDIVLVNPIPPIHPRPGSAGRFLFRASDYFSDPDGQTISISAFAYLPRPGWLLAPQVGKTSIVFAWSDQSISGNDIRITVSLDKEQSPSFVPHDFAFTLAPLVNRPPVFSRAQPPRSISARINTFIYIGGSFRDPDGDSLTFRGRTEDNSIVLLRKPDGGFASRSVEANARGYLTVWGVADGTTGIAVLAIDPSGARSTEYRFPITVEDPPVSTNPGRHNPAQLEATLAVPLEIALSDYITPNTPDDQLHYELHQQRLDFDIEIIDQRLRLTVFTDEKPLPGFVVDGINPRGRVATCYFNVNVIVPDIDTASPLSDSLITRMFHRYGSPAEVRDDKRVKLFDTRAILSPGRASRELTGIAGMEEWQYLNEDEILVPRACPVTSSINVLGTENEVISSVGIIAEGHVLYHKHDTLKTSVTVVPVAEVPQFGTAWTPTFCEVGRPYSYNAPFAAGTTITHTIEGLPPGLVYHAATGVISGTVGGPDAGLSVNEAGDALEGTLVEGDSYTITITATPTSGDPVQISGDLVVEEAGTLVPYALQLAVAWRSLPSPEITEMEKIGWILRETRSLGRFGNILYIAIMEEMTEQAIDAMRIVFAAFIADGSVVLPVAAKLDDDKEIVLTGTNTVIAERGRYTEYWPDGMWLSVSSSTTISASTALRQRIAWHEDIFGPRTDDSIDPLTPFVPGLLATDEYGSTIPGKPDISNAATLAIAKKYLPVAPNYRLNPYNGSIRAPYASTTYNRTIISRVWWDFWNKGRGPDGDVIPVVGTEVTFATPSPGYSKYTYALTLPPTTGSEGTDFPAESKLTVDPETGEITLLISQSGLGFFPFQMSATNALGSSVLYGVVNAKA